MEWIAIAIVVSTCLYLVDKNQKWKVFRRVLIWAFAALAVLVGSFALWQEHQSNKALAQRPPQIKWDK